MPKPSSWWLRFPRLKCPVCHTTLVFTFKGRGSVKAYGSVKIEEKRVLEPPVEKGVERDTTTG